MRDYTRLDRFLDHLAGDIYPEPPSELHSSLTRSAIAELVAGNRITRADRVLDIGCGQGLALEQFRDHGIAAVGIALGPDIEACRAKGLDVRPMDQSFLDFADASFDVLWCRHVLEHSVAPFFTLSEYRRVIRAGGLAYVEVPAPDTAAHHERNPNHYSVLPHSLWAQLFARAGFAVERQVEIRIELAMGPDRYWAYVLRAV